VSVAGFFNFHFGFSIANTCRSYENKLADVHVFTCIGAQNVCGVSQTKRFLIFLTTDSSPVSVSGGEIRDSEFMRVKKLLGFSRI
jgi:hypothetical protein